MTLRGYGFSSGVQLLKLWENGDENKGKAKFVGFLAIKKNIMQNSKEIKPKPNSLLKTQKDLPKTIVANKMMLSAREPNKLDLESINDDSNKANVSVSQINIDKKAIPIQTEEAYKKATKPETVPFSKLIERKTTRPNQNNKIHPQPSSKQTEFENENFIRETNKLEDLNRPLSSNSSLA